MNQPNRIHLTKEGYEELQNELQAIKNKEPQAIDRVTRAREMGDLSENSEYHAAREELAFMQGRIEELEEILAQAKLISNSKANGRVSLGSTVTVKTQNGDDVTFTLVGEYEADPTKKKISYDSPLGKALMGRSIKETIEYEAPVGKVVYTIQQVA